MSNRRKPPLANAYRTQFLHSRAWFARRGRWFREEVDAGRSLNCALCNLSARACDLELHHLDYSGVRRRGGTWFARERHTDLLALHPRCHDLLHQLIDRDEVLAYHRDRRTASVMALIRLRRALASSVEGR